VWGQLGEAGVIALLFALLVAAIVLAWRDQWKWSYVLFAVTILLSIYWLDFHATSKLSIHL
jgi:preprotein translocase subunit SecF